MDLANESIWITVASFLVAFEVVKAVDCEGRVIEPSGEYSSGLLWYVVRIALHQRRALMLLAAIRCLSDV
jgi:hypothetical protein